METTIVKAFELVMILCKKFNIDESHSLKHSMEVYNFALRIYESELPMNAYLEEQKDIIVLAAILHDTLDKIAEEIQIPTEIHEYLHVNSREVWVETMVSLIDTGQIKPSARQIKVLAENWEELLCRKYSNLN